MLVVILKKNEFLLVRHDDWEFYQISKMDVYHRLFSDSLENAIRFEKNWVLNDKKTLFLNNLETE